MRNKGFSCLAILSATLLAACSDDDPCTADTGRPDVAIASPGDGSIYGDLQVDFPGPMREGP